MLRALSLADGHQLWAQTAGQDIYGEWLVAGGVVVLADQVGKHATLTRYNAVTGAQAWRYQIPGEGLYRQPVRDRQRRPGVAPRRRQPCR